MPIDKQTPMDAKTLEALEASIKHWEENAAAEVFDEVAIDPDACALCKRFWNVSCGGCPVSEHTGKSACVGSPYDVASDAYEDWQDAGPDEEDTARDNWRKAAEAERDFLKSLLPKKEEDVV